MTSVGLVSVARKQLQKAPKHIVISFARWVDAVESMGLKEIQKYPGYRDKSLRGKRRGQRSIRLSRKWRAIYVVTRSEHIELVYIVEINAHDY